MSVPELTQSLTAALSHKKKRVVLTSQDVKQLPRLTGAADIDVNSCLSQFRLIAGFKARGDLPSNASAEELESVGDSVAFEYMPLICNGPILLLYQHIMSGSINWRAPVVSTESSDEAGSYVAPSNWSELKSAMLDCLMPSNLVEESALRFITFKQLSSETVASYALCYQNECTRFSEAVKRATPGRSPYNALSVILFQHGLKASIQCLALSDPPPTTLTKAIERARRHEAANLTGLNHRTVSAVDFTHVPNRTAIAQQFTAVSQGQQASGGSGSASGASPSNSGASSSAGGAGGGGSGGGGTGGGTGSGNSRGNPGGGRGNGGGKGKHPTRAHNRNHNSNANRPVCTYPGCLKPLGHTEEKCYQKKREQSGGSSGSNGGGGGNKRTKTNHGK